MSDDTRQDYQTQILEEIRRDVRLVRTAVFGNGKVGLAEEVRTLKDWRESMDRSAARTGSRTWDFIRMVIAAILGGAVTVAVTLFTASIL